jgi:hypothetical protein
MRLYGQNKTADDKNLMSTSFIEFSLHKDVYNSYSTEFDAQDAHFDKYLLTKTKYYEMEPNPSFCNEFIKFDFF